ncbi:MAG TPA: DUF1003 domain-containing protein [Candidatus Acidoferrales bacterium]|nr:DUF1003 domain-containing protein [Candidatus Acidoferrales bacterium]
MAVAREIEDIARALIKHQHDHPPIRDLNRENDRRRSFAERMADDLGRLIGSWTFVVIQLLLIGIWIALNLLARIHHWDAYPFPFLAMVLSLEAALWASLVLMAMGRAQSRDRLRAQKDYEIEVKGEEELRMLMNHLEVQDEVLLQILHRLDRTDRELRRLARRLDLSDD